MRLINWISAWATTLHIMLFERDTYRALREPFDPGNFIEVAAPTSDGE